jgi:predicted MFS family arabinose efflux permease
MAAQRIILASGLWNLGLAIGVFVVAQLIAPAARSHMGIPDIQLFWTLILCGVLGVTGCILVLAARDLASRGSIVYYEGLARLVAAALLLTVGPSELGTPAQVIGIADLCWGLVQTVALPRWLGRTHVQMLLDRMA